MKSTYACLEQRMVDTYIETFPDLRPSEAGPAANAQQRFYRFMRDLYQQIYDEPTLLFANLHDDDAHTRRFNKRADGKPKLTSWMRAAAKKVDALLMTLFEIGQRGQVSANTLIVAPPVKLSRRHRAVLARLGLGVITDAERLVLSHANGAELFVTWVWLATRAEASLLGFGRCLFDSGHAYASDIYARLSGDVAAFRRLERYLIDHDYSRMDNWDGALSLDYYRTLADNQPPTKGGFQYGIHHMGISASYDVQMDTPPVYGLCIPRMKEILTAFDTLPARVQHFVAMRTKACDGCRYCVQTDKTGKRPLANIRVAHDGRTLRLCPYYPGYSYCWSQLSDEIVDDMIAMLEAMNRLFDRSA